MSSENFYKTLARTFRNFAEVKGKERIGRELTSRLFNVKAFSQPVIPVGMRDGSTILLDVRSKMELGAVWSGLYEPKLVRRLTAYLQAGDVVLDIGANIGFIAVPLARRLRELGSGHIYSFEPVPANYSRLVDNIKQNELEAFVTSFQMALGDENGTIQMSMESGGDASTGNAFFSTLNDPTLTVTKSEAPLRRLDAIATEQSIRRVDLVKIDVEGAEVLSLRGGQEIIKKYRPVCAGEFNQFWIAQFGLSFVDVWKIFEPLGYEIYKETDAGFTRVTEVTPQISDVLLVPNDLAQPRRQALGIG